MADLIKGLLLKFNPNKIIIENTVRGRNRSVQRLLRVDSLFCIKNYSTGGPVVL